ncbi:MAG: hypothetical protein KA956_13735 [Pyrinomonadaceae bacterium]|nr:hypothetical protein [Acidobacteriota bacterium]MBP7377531.1 hypothetical protein [Pyrinomonadaceae bacterium]
MSDWISASVRSVLSAGVGLGEGVLFGAATSGGGPCENAVIENSNTPIAAKCTKRILF